ncbi:MAG: hypothetical protein H7Y31_13000, partial [Chitinophagaceae bacterium]|nr:hypothetical protein [Chitinophagaceae bacterium]
MKRALLFCMMLVSGLMLRAQPVSFPQLLGLLDMTNQQIDTMMKAREFRLLQKEVDSTSVLTYYSNVERDPKAVTWVRSITIHDIQLRSESSRLVTYRIYRKKEYVELLEWLLKNNF